jgi:ubiquitin C-terminal hydrolase
MNLGNTCYMNSFMQALFMTKKFKSTILDIRDDKNLSSNKEIAYALINLFTELSTKNIKSDNDIFPHLFKSLTPEPFRNSS